MINEFNICLWDGDGIGLEISKNENSMIFVQMVWLTGKPLERSPSEDGTLFKAADLKSFLKKAVCLLEEEQC